VDAGGDECEITASADGLETASVSEKHEQQRTKQSDTEQYTT